MQLRPRWAWVLGTALVVVAATAGAFLGDETDRAIPALLLIAPGIVAALVGGSRPALLVAIEGAAAFGFLLPPRGSVRVHAGEDLVALTTFVVVALVTARLVGRAMAAQQARTAALEALEAQRRSLLRAVSHDLRTPLTVIRAATSDLGAGDLDAGARADLAELVADEAERLDRLVANLLNLSRIDAGALRLDRTPIDLRHLVESSLTRLRRLTRDVRIEADLADDVPLVDGDAVQLEQVVTNLVENAVRHSAPGGIVEVRVAPVRGARRTGIEVSVADRGSGLPTEDQALLFTPFTPLADGRSSGVGLAICKAIIEAHGGTIHGCNRAGGGATLRFVIDARADE